MTNNGYQQRPTGLLVKAEHTQPVTDDDRPGNGHPDTTPHDLAPAEPAVSKTVQQRREQATEAEELLEIQQRDRSHEVDTKRVRKAKAKAVQAGKLRHLHAHPDAVALRDARMRLWTTIAALFAAVCALGWSTASVQVTAADEAATASVGWFLAFLVEPLISTGLLATITVQAYAAVRGRVVDPDSEHGRTLRSTQRWLLGLTITLNTWPYVSPFWTDQEFNLIQVIVHLVGPIVAVRMIHSLPAMWATLENLPIDEPATSSNTPSSQANHLTSVTSTNGTFPQVNGHIHATRTNGDPVIARARRELGCGVSGKQVARWHRARIGRVSQERIGEIRDALKPEVSA